MTRMDAVSVVHISQGECCACSAPNVVMTTVLGSCVSVCLHDPLRRIGGMNHFLVPRSRSGSLLDNRSGVNAMELLVNEVLKAGARRDGLRAKVFGGARMIGLGTEIGKMNSRFALQFLENEGIYCDGGDTGGQKGRRIRFWPATGAVQRRLFDGLLPAEVDAVRQSGTRGRPQDTGPDVELF